MNRPYSRPLTQRIEGPRTLPERIRALMQEALLAVVRMLYPFTPHASYVLWQELGGEGSVDRWRFAVPDRVAEHGVAVHVSPAGNGRRRARSR